jgi:O-glycosyl hydrolase
MDGFLQLTYPYQQSAASNNGVNFTMRNKTYFLCILTFTLTLMTLTALPAFATSLTRSGSSQCVDASDFGDGSIMQVWSCYDGPKQQYELAPLGNNVFEIKLAGTNECLDVDSMGLYSNGTAIHLYGCWAGSQQQWRLELRSDGRKRVVSNSSGKCLDSGNGANGQNLFQCDCWDGATQAWDISGGSVAPVTPALPVSPQNSLVNANTPLRILRDSTQQSLDIGAAANGGVIQLWAAHNGANQVFEFVPSDQSYFEIKLSGSNFCFDIDSTQVGTNGTAASLYQCWGGANQLWRAENRSDGKIHLVSKASGKCLDSGNGDNGQRLFQWDCWNGASQAWSFSAATAIDPGKVPPSVPAAINTVRGWGMSLAWEANDLYGGGRAQPSQVPDPARQSAYMDLLFGDPNQRLTLGFNIARYNIGGGENPEHSHMRADAQMDGFLDAPGGQYDWSKDAAQRRMLHEAKNRGANLFEAFSNSPPYWMTYSGCASGANGWASENLRPEFYQAFVDYLATVTRHFRDAEGINFESLEAFNEPDGGWWTANGSQEGNFVGIAAQNQLIPMVANALNYLGLGTFASGVDSNNFDTGAYFISQYSGDAVRALGRVNVHSYNGSQPTRLHDAVSSIGKPLWESEVGCCFSNQGDNTEMWGALFMSDRIREAPRDMRAEAFVLWQPDWGVIDFGGGNPRPLKQYYAVAQASSFIRPGYQILPMGPSNALVAYSPAERRLVVVFTNWSNASNDIDLSVFQNLPGSARRYITTDDADVSLRSSSIGISGGHISENIPARAIVTYVVDGI